MTAEQRTLFRETQAVMSLLEGFSDYVMDEVGKDLVPGVERISARFHERRLARRSPFERAVMRLTGMDVKLEQYAKGEAFVSAIAAAGGAAALNRLWAGPEMLPRHGEIDDPAAWLARTGRGSDAPVS
jgi:putative hydrolase